MSDANGRYPTNEQRGYQDAPREPRRDQKPAEKKEYAPRGQPPLAPKTFNMPGFREVVRCAPLRQRADGGGRLESRRGLRPVRRRPARLRPVRAFRHRRAVRVPAADSVACLAEGRPEQLHLLRAPHHGRARDEVRRPDERAEGVRRPVQVETVEFRGNRLPAELTQPKPQAFETARPAQTGCPLPFTP